MTEKISTDRLTRGIKHWVNWLFEPPYSNQSPLHIDSKVAQNTLRLTPLTVVQKNLVGFNLFW
jgi:hypothetical protein